MNSNQRISKRIFQCNSDYSTTIDRAPATKKRWQSLIASVCAFLLTISSAGPIVEAGESADQSQPITTSDALISTAALELLLIPLSKNELLIEADGWQGIVKVKALEIARAEIVVLRQNNEIDKAEEIKAKTAAAKAQLEKVLKKVDESNATGDPDKVSEAQQAAADATRR